MSEQIPKCDIDSCNKQATVRFSLWVELLHTDNTDMIVVDTCDYHMYEEIKHGAKHEVLKYY